MEKINFTKDLKNVFLSLWRLVKDAFRYLYRLLKKIKLKTVKTVVGAFLVIVAYVAIAIDGAGGLLMLIDPIQFNRIVYGLLEVNLFAYIGPFEYYSLVLGVLFMEIVFWCGVAVLGWYMLGKKVKNFNEKLSLAGTLFIFGIFSFCIGMYYSLPEVKIPLEQISEKLDKKHSKKYYHFDPYELNIDQFYIEESYRNY